MDNIRSWINGTDDSQAFLLLGQAGVGKSAIAHRVAQEAKQARRLGAFFCFSADTGPENFFRTIARRLADLEPAYASVLMANTDSSLKTTPSLTRQVEELLTRPFQTLAILGAIIIVVDALDECTINRDELIHCLHENIHLFPKNIRFFITSRPSEATNLARCPWVQTHYLKVDSTSASSDLYTFVKVQLTDPIEKQVLLGFDDSKLNDIVTSSQGLFQYAAVVCITVTTGQNYQYCKFFSRFEGICRNLQESEGIRGNQRESAGIRGNQRESEGISGNQKELAGIGRNQQEQTGMKRNA